MSSNQISSTPLTAPIPSPQANPAVVHAPPTSFATMGPAAPYASPFDQQPYENVQYLSRQHFYHPPVVALGPLPPPDKALAAIEGMLRDQWGKYRSHQPFDVHPTFSAAPQSRYVGSYTAPGGQMVHRSIAMNNLEVLTDERSGLPYTIAGHTVRDTYAVPTVDNAVWRYELFYPSNERLRDEMVRCMKEPLADGDSGFPVHATQHPPGMDDSLWAHESCTNETQRTRVFSAAEPLTPMTRRFGRDHPGTVAPSETIRISDPRVRDSSLHARHSPDSDTTTSSMPPLEPIPVPSMAERLAQLDQDVLTRASRSLNDEHDPWLVAFDNELRKQLTELSESVMSGEDAQDKGLGICEVCFEPAHDPWTPCPPNATWRPPTPPFMIPGHPPTPPLFIAHQPAKDPQDDKDNQSGQQIQHMVQETLGPILDEFVNMPSSEEGAWDGIATKAQEARAIFEQLTAILEERCARAEELRNSARVLENKVDNLNHRAEPGTENAGARGGDLSETETSAARALTSLAQRPASAPVGSHESFYMGAVNSQDLDRANKEATHEAWTSSFNTNSSAESFLDIGPYASHPHQPAVNARGIVTPAVSEWVQAQRGNFSGHAGYNYLAPQEELGNTYLAHAARERWTSPTDHFFQSTLPTRHIHELSRWVEDGVQCHSESLQWEDGVHGDPLRDALGVVHGPLARFVDYSAMVSSGIQSLSYDSTLPAHLRALASTPDSPPDPTQSPTSLDFSLPSTSTPYASYMAENQVNGSEFRMEPMHLGAKRSPPSPDEERLDARKRRKCPTGLADAEVVRKFAGVRQGCLEGARRIEGAVWARYPVTQEHFPAQVVPHPFFREDEVLKMFVLHNVLQAHGRHVLASLLADVLAIRVRDEYTVSNLLNAGCLDATYPPDGDQPWWKLLEATDTDTSLSDVGSDDASISSLGYPLGHDKEALGRAMEGVSSHNEDAQGTDHAINNDCDRRMDCDSDSASGRVIEPRDTEKNEFDQFAASTLGLRLQNGVPTIFPFL
ncbi:hypothetical protein C8R47DRAFT_1210498 [Mycena vitilis]|nr:hypothetical protein C8R47DRAFT_1210498 [Mycena vitilis]